MVMGKSRPGAQRRVTTDDGVAIVYDDHGPREGETVVLCHGLAAAGEQLAADAEYFAGLGYRVLVPDLRGHGQSGTPPGCRPEDFTLARLAADMAAMLDDAGAGKAHWVGNSLGGIVALALIGAQPERIASLTTFGTAYSLSLPPFGARAIPWSYGLLGSRMLAWLTARGTTRNAGARPLIAKLIRQFDPRVGRAVGENVARYDLIASALGFSGPILMLRGGRDAQVNAALGPTLRAMQGRANFTLVEIPEGGHCANLDASEAFRSALLAFWQSAGA